MGQHLRTVVYVAACFLVCSTATEARSQLRTVTEAKGFARPVAIVQDPTNPAVQFVVEQGGRIRVVQNGTVLPIDFLDLVSAVAPGSERGLLGLAFAPDYAVSGRFFVNFTAVVDAGTVVARFRRSADPLVADPASRFDLRWPGGATMITQPFASHNGGHLAFGPDGFLYIGLGDGGASGDPYNLAQNPAQLLGKMLRIDVNVPDSHPTGYQIPPSNPFVSSGPSGVRPEIWSMGWRNPWRYSFDDVSRGGTGALIVGDVGQNAFEEVDYEPAGRGGRNYGWDIREGMHNYDPSTPPAFLPLTEPIFHYGHTPRGSITGGFVYRGSALGSLYLGRYFFADFVTGKVWSVALTIDPSTEEATASDLMTHSDELDPAALGNISSFGVDSNGELLILNYSSGTVLRVLPALAPTLTPASATVAPGSMASMAIGTGTGNTRDWIGMFCPATAGDAQVGDWKYLNNTRTAPASGLRSATATLRVPLTAAGGTCNVRLFWNDGYTKLATSATFAVRPSATLTVTTPTVVTGGTVSVTVENAPGNRADWISLFPSSAADDGGRPWSYLNGLRVAPATGLSTASIVFVAPSMPGTYNFRLFADDGFNKLASSGDFTVSATTPTLTLVNTTVTAGATAGVLVANGPGNPTDWISLSPSSAADDGTRPWSYLNGLKTAPAVGLSGATVSFTVPTVPGMYNFRLFANNSFTKLATSGVFSVSP